MTKSKGLDYNDPRILRTYLDQAFSNEPEKTTLRMSVGNNGGLAYSLFSDPESPDITIDLYDPRVCSLKDLREGIDYYQKILAYLNFAETHAKKYEFGLVRFNEKGQLVPLKNPDGIFEAAIGRSPITSEQHLVQFREMIMSGRRELDDYFNELFRKNKEYSKKQ